MPAQRRIVIVYLFQKMLQRLSYAFLWLVLALLLLPIFGSMLSGNFSQLNLSRELRNSSLGFTLLLLAAVIAMYHYDDFKLLIQNGISRRTYWQAKIIALTWLTLLTQLVGYLYRFLICGALNGHNWKQASLYMSVYGSYFKSRLVNQLLGILFGLLFALTLVFFFNFVGGILSLFPRKQKYLILIAVTAIGIVFLLLLFNWTRMHSTQATAIVNFIFGYEKRDSLNPTMPFIDLIIANIVGLAGSWGVSRYFQLRND